MSMSSDGASSKTVLACVQNMGHESERITETHYAKFSDDRRLEVLESIVDNENVIEFNLTVEEKAELFDKMLAQLKLR